MAAHDRSNLGTRALNGAAWMVGFRMVSRLLGVASTFLLARLLNRADFGIVAIAFTLSAAFNSLSNVGVTENLVRHPHSDRDVLDTGFTLQVIKGLITGALLLAIAPLAATWFHEPRLTAVIDVLALAFALSGLENVGVIQFRRDMRFDREFIISAIERLGSFATTVLCAVLLHSYWALVIGTLASKVARVAATYAIHPYRPRLGLRAWHELAGFSLWMWLSSLAYIVWIRADPLVLGSSVPKAALGIFVLAVDIALLPTTEVLDPIAAVLFAGFAAERNAGRDPRPGAFGLALTLMLVMAPIGLLISANSTYVVGILLGQKWTEAAPIIAILTMTVVLSPFSYTASIVLTAIGKLKANLAVVVTASAVKLVLLSIAARTGDLHLIALASLAITSVESALFILCLRWNGGRFAGLGWPLLRILAGLAASALAMSATGLAWAGAVAVPLLDSVSNGVILGLVGAGSYLGMLFGLWYLAGRPDGPERHVSDTMVPLLGRVLLRLRQRAAPPTKPAA